MHDRLLFVSIHLGINKYVFKACILQKISQVHSYLGNFVFLVTDLVRQNLKIVLVKEISNCFFRIQEYIA